MCYSDFFRELLTVFDKPIDKSCVSKAALLGSALVEAGVAPVGPRDWPFAVGNARLYWASLVTTFCKTSSVLESES